MVSNRMDIGHFPITWFEKEWYKRKVNSFLAYIFSNNLISLNLIVLPAYTCLRYQNKLTFMKKKLFLGFLVFNSFLSSTTAQNLTPVAINGLNHDVIAETYIAANALTTTDTTLDLGNKVWYSRAYAVAAGIGGGLPNNGSYSVGNRTFQMAPYNAFNSLTTLRGNTRTLNISTPAAYQRLSLLAFSTQGNSLVNVRVEFTDGSSFTNSGINMLDWFNGYVNVADSGYGRINRTNNAVDGLPNNPRMYYYDIEIPCNHKDKLISKLHISNLTATGEPGNFPCAVIMAVSGELNTQNISLNVLPSACGPANGTATITASGNTGPYSYSWNTNPVQTSNAVTGLAAGNYIVTVTDAAGCSKDLPFTITQLVSPTSITATASAPVICSGNSTTLSVTSVGAGLTSFEWLPGNFTGSSITVSPGSTTTYSVVGKDAAGCNYVRQVTVVVNQVPPAPIIPAVNFCQGDPAELKIQNSGSGLTYNWFTSPTGGTPFHTGSSYTMITPGTAIYYVGATSNGCSTPSRTTASITMLPAPTVNAGPGKTIVAGDLVQLNATASPGTYVWSPSTGLSAINILNPVASPTTTTTYSLRVTHASGCVKTSDLTIIVLPYCVKPMDAFSPNGDGQNDLWLVTNGNCLDYAKVSVYNRYGAAVYENQDYKNNWNGTYKGKPLADGTYYYIITYKLINGKAVLLRGNVTILR
jgi:gliding motility-associated-like protein